MLHKALPLGGIIRSRIGKGDPNCATCGEYEEDIMHFSFHCAFSRSCWFTGPLQLSSGHLTGNLQEVLQNLRQGIDEEQWTDLANSLWSIWRCRNGRAYAAEAPNRDTFLKYLQSISTESMIAASTCKKVPPQSNISSSGEMSEGLVCFTDGSFDQKWQGGAGYVIFRNGELVKYRSVKIVACSPLQAEAIAMKEALLEIQMLGGAMCNFLSDSSQLVEVATAAQPPLDIDWRAHSECFEIWKHFRLNQGLTCNYIPRDQNDLADQLAKLAKVQGWDCKGFTFPVFRT